MRQLTTYEFMNKKGNNLVAAINGNEVVVTVLQTGAKAIATRTIDDSVILNSEFACKLANKEDAGFLNAMINAAKKGVDVYTSTEQMDFVNETGFGNSWVHCDNCFAYRYVK